jgi:hypothetical protein
VPREVDDLFGLPVTSGAVGVLEGRQCAPGDALDRKYHPLESPAVAGGAVAIPGRQDVLNCASVKVCEGLSGQAKFLQPPEVVTPSSPHCLCMWTISDRQ